MDYFNTVLPADSVEFCPHTLATNVFVCGTYKLEQPTPVSQSSEENTAPAAPQKRVGKCLVFQVNDDKKSFSPIHEISSPAILDMKWCHTSASRSPLLAIADSEGHLTLTEWDINQGQLNNIANIACATSDVLCLSLDWSNRRSHVDTIGSVVVSLSNGKLALLKPENATGLSVTDTWVAHEYEPWVAAWNYWDTNVIYSGGDDLRMKAWDIRQGFNRPSSINKQFDAGITSIQSHPHVEHVVAVGSYDNTVRIYDSRKLLTPLVQVDVGGGAWRIKWHPSVRRQHDLLVACMHSGFKVIKLANTWTTTDELTATLGESWETMQRFDKHESLAYGVDWSHAEDVRHQDKVQETLIASASFYDCALHLWSG